MNTQTLICAHSHRKFTVKDGWVCKNCDKALTEEEVPSREGIPQFGFGDLKESVKAVNNREARWNKDMPAYKRLRQQGYQPKTIDGAAHIEAKATTRFEIESGQVLEGQTKKIEAAVEAVEHITGKSVFDPNVKPVNL